MAVFQLLGMATFRAEQFGLDQAGIFTVDSLPSVQIFSDTANATQMYLSFLDPVTYAYRANITSTLGFALDHSTFGDTFDTLYYANSALHDYAGITSDFAFYDYSSGAAVLIGTLTGSVYDLSVRDSYERVQTETAEISHHNTVETFTGLFMGDDQVTLGAQADYFCDPQGSLDLRLGGGDDLGVHMLGAAADRVRIWGEAGNDRLSVQGGTGALYGGTGRDWITAGPDGAYVIDGGSGGDLIYGRQVTIRDGAGSGDDDYSADGSGLALLSYATATRGIVVDLWTGFARSREIGNDTVVGFRQLEGGQGDDQLTGMPFGQLTEFGDTIWGNAGNDSVLGTYQADSLYGDAGNDRLAGQDGNDLQTGGAGDDRLFGGVGDDTLLGGAGRDLLTGDAGLDVFAFVSTAESSLATPDRIIDFVQMQDRIDLHRIDARTGSPGNEAFRFVGEAAFTAAGQVRMFQSGADTVIEANTTGTSGAEMRLVLTGLWELQAGDFSL